MKRQGCNADKPTAQKKAKQEPKPKALTLKMPICVHADTWNRKGKDKMHKFSIPAEAGEFARSWQRRVVNLS